MKSICQSKKLADLKTDGARLLYTWLLPNLDINGCFSADADVLKGHIFTRLKKPPKQINDYLMDLERVGLIITYQSNDDVFLCVPDFTEKQPSLNPNKEAKPTIPPPTPEQLQTYSRATPPKVKQSKEKVKQSKEKENFPDCLNTDEFLQIWSDWEKYRREIKKKLTPTTIKRQLKLLAEHPESAIEMVEQSIRNGWQGLFVLKEKNGGQNGRTDKTIGQLEPFIR